MVTTAYPWEGPTTYIRPAVTRGSAAGAHYSEVHVLAGMDREGDRARCGMLFRGTTVRTRQPKAGRDTLRVCIRCLNEDGGLAGPWPEDEQENTGAEA